MGAGDAKDLSHQWGQRSDGSSDNGTAVWLGPMIRSLRKKG